MTEQTDTKPKGMRPIWYFVGWLLLIIGCIVSLTGLYGLISPPDQRTVLYELHTGIWWGAIVAVTGVVFLRANKDVVVE